MTQPDNILSSDDAQEILCRGNPLIDSIVKGIIEIDPGSSWDEEIVIDNCALENFSCIMIMFKKKVVIRNSYLKNANFMFSYFIGGLQIENCIFDRYLNFEAGGHNEPGNIVLFKNNHFKGFVNFFDCWYTGEVMLKDNTFYNATNILSKEQLITFDMSIFTDNNIGDLSTESES